jgi:hypothetical protein
MKAKFAHSAPIPAFGAAPVDRAPRARPLRFQAVESLVTVAVIAWFAVALAELASGLHGVAPAPVTQAAAGTERPGALPQASTSVGDPARPRMRLI